MLPIYCLLRASKLFTMGNKTLDWELQRRNIVVRTHGREEWGYEAENSFHMFHSNMYANDEGKFTFRQKAGKLIS